MSNNLTVAAACGAISQEVLYWYSLRANLNQSKLKALARNPFYWLITTAMTAVSTVGTYLWYEGTNVDVRHYLILGASFPLLLKAAIPAVIPKKTLLGAGDSSLRDYFRLQEVNR